MLTLLDSRVVTWQHQYLSLHFQQYIIQLASYTITVQLYSIAFIYLGLLHGHNYYKL